MANTTLVFKHSFRGEPGKCRYKNLMSTPTCLIGVITVCTDILGNQEFYHTGAGDVGMLNFTVYFFQCSNKHFCLGYVVDITCLVF